MLHVNLMENWNNVSHANENVQHVPNVSHTTVNIQHSMNLIVD